VIGKPTSHGDVLCIVGDRVVFVRLEDVR
jgi:hypothetical protein